MEEKKNKKGTYGGKYGTPNRYGFLAYNIVYAIWNTLIIPYTPAFIVGGIIPSQLVYYIIGLCVTSVVWGWHIHKFLEGQPLD